MAETSVALQRSRNHTLQSLFAALDPKAFLFSQNSTSTSISSQISISETTGDFTSPLQQNNSSRNQNLVSISETMGDFTSPLQQNNRSRNQNLESPFAALERLESDLSDFSVERGPRYRAYSELRESRLRTKYNMMVKQQQSSDVPESKVTPSKKRVSYQGPAPSGARNGKSVVTQSVPDFSALLRKENRRPRSPTLPSILEMTPPLPSKNSKLSVVSSKLGSKSASAMEKKGGGAMMRKSYANVEELKGLSSAVASAINGENRGKGSRGINRTVLGYRHC